MPDRDGPNPEGHKTTVARVAGGSRRWQGKIAGLTKLDRVNSRARSLDSGYPESEA